MVPSDETQEGGNGESVNEEVVTEDTAAATEHEAADGVNEASMVASDDAPDEPTSDVDGPTVGDAPPYDESAPAGGTFEDAPASEIEAEAEADKCDGTEPGADEDEGGYEITEAGRAALAEVDADVQEAIDQIATEHEEDDDENDIRNHPAMQMLKGLSDGTKSREEGRKFIDENYPELND